MMNAASNQIDEIFGLAPRNRYQAPPPTYLMGGTTNHFNVANSVIGTINTGVVRSLNTSLNNVAVGNPELAGSLNKLAEKIGANSELDEEKKEAALESITFLAEQAQKDAGSRNKSMIQAAGKTIIGTIGAMADVATLAPIVLKILGAIGGQ